MWWGTYRFVRFGGWCVQDWVWHTAEQLAAVGDELGAGREAGIVGNDEQHQLGDLFGLGDAQAIRLVLSDGSERIVRPWGVLVLPLFASDGSPLEVLLSEFVISQVVMSDDAA
jgi:hypothetical protein